MRFLATRTSSKKKRGKYCNEQALQASSLLSNRFTTSRASLFDPWGVFLLLQFGLSAVTPQEVFQRNNPDQMRTNKQTLHFLLVCF